MATGAPDFGDSSVEVFNPLIYPRRVLIQVLESAFSQANLFVFPGSTPNPYQLKFAADGEPADDSGIVIADSFSDSLLAQDPRPVVVVDRGSFNFSDTTIDGLGQGSATPMLTSVGSSGQTSKVIGGSGVQQTYQDFATMSVGISCYSRRSIEAEEVAWICAAFIRFFEREIKQGAHLHRLDSPTIGEPRVVRADSQNALFMCPITLVVHQTLSWVKSNTAAHADILAGLQKLSGSTWPKAFVDPPCAESVPEGLTDTQANKWLGK